MIDELEYVLDRFSRVVDSVAADYSLEDDSPVQLRRVDRMNSRVFDDSDPVDMSTPLSSRTAELKRSALVGVAFADQEATPTGTGYNHEFERVIEVRVEGLSHHEWGHIDPDGDHGVPFGELVRRLRKAVLGDRQFPDATDDPDTQYHSLTVTNDAPQSHRYADYYRYDFDVVPDGYRKLP